MQMCEKQRVLKPEIFSLNANKVTAGGKVFLSVINEQAEIVVPKEKKSPLHLARVRVPRKDKRSGLKSIFILEGLPPRILQG